MFGKLRPISCKTSSYNLHTQNSWLLPAALQALSSIPCSEAAPALMPCSEEGTAAALKARVLLLKLQYTFRAGEQEELP